MFDSSTTTAALDAEMARLRVDGRDRSVADLVAVVERCQAVVNHATALQTLAMAHLAAIEDVELEDGTVVEQHRGLGHHRLDAPSLVSDQLGVSDAAAASRMAVAVDVVTRVPAVFEVMAAGRLDGYRAGIVAEELRDAPPDVCHAVVARIGGRLGSEPPAALRRRVRAALYAVDPDLLRTKAARARAARSLPLWPGDEPGVDTWMGSFPVEHARSGWAIVDRLARQYVQEGRASGADEARADALMDLIHARATGTFVVQLAVPATPVATAQPASPVPTKATGAEDDAVVSVTGLGLAGATEVRRTWAESLLRAGGQHGSATLPGTGTSATGTTSATGANGGLANSTPPSIAVHHEVVACHADTGALLSLGDGHDSGVDTQPGTEPASKPTTEAKGVFAKSAARPGRRRGGGRRRATESTAYRPPPALVDLVKARDGRCRFPGCSVSAVFCDLDHVTPWPAGRTQATNLMCLCRRHHRVKQSLRWRVRIDADATVTWTDPTGRRRTTLPLDLLQLDRAQPGHPLSAQVADLTEGADTPTPGRPGAVGHGSKPVAEAAVLWSAWEEELDHWWAASERAGARNRARGRAEPSARRPHWTGGPQRLLLHQRYVHRRGVDNGHGRARASERARAKGPPPF